MDNSWTLFQQIAPDIMAVCEQRYEVLRQIKDSQPIGRRMLGQKRNVSERVIRSQVDMLRSVGLVEFTPLGVCLTEAGEEILPRLSRCFLEMKGIQDIRDALCTALPIQELYIVPGNSDDTVTVQTEIGRIASQLLMKKASPNQTVAVSGGTTMEKLASQLIRKKMPLCVVPARGGIGERVECQANMIAAVIAEKTGGTYHMIHIPDGVTGTALQVLLENEPRTLEVAQMAEQADIVLFGIGRADVMAKKRMASEELKKELQDQGACGEALGCYCALDGHIVRTANNVGLSVEKLKPTQTVIAAAGGASKARAIISVLQAAQTGILVTDEGAARAMKDIVMKRVKD